MDCVLPTPNARRTCAPRVEALGHLGVNGGDPPVFLAPFGISFMAWTRTLAAPTDAQDAPSRSNTENAARAANRQNASRAANTQDASGAADTEHTPRAGEAQHADDAVETEGAQEAASAANTCAGG